MLRRLVYVVVASTTMLVGITYILRYFSDVLPLASTEPQSTWQVEMAYLLTAAQWIVLAVVALGSIAIIVVSRRSLRRPSR